MDGEWPFQRGNQIPSANAVRIGANDARHREHLMAPARQLTSSASLKGKGCREIRLLEVRRLVARGGLFESNQLIPTDVKRPRNVDWKRAAAILYGDWGTSKAYVIGLAFAVAGYSS